MYHCGQCCFFCVIGALCAIFAFCLTFLHALQVFYPPGQLARETISLHEVMTNPDNSEFLATYALCLFFDGVLDDIIFNTITIILVTTPGSAVGGTLVYVSMAVSAMLILGRLVRSYIALIAPYTGKLTEFRRV